jgi:hypothetical protein
MVVASVLSAGALLGGGIGIGHALAASQSGASRGNARLASHSVARVNHASLVPFAVVRATPSPSDSGARSGNGSTGKGSSGTHHCPDHSGN